MDSAHTKTNILLQAHFGQIPLPSTDYNTDTKSVLDQAIRILQVNFAKSENGALWKKEYSSTPDNDN